MADSLDFSATHDERTSYEALFIGSGARDGKLEGSVVADMLRRTNMPNDVLSRVWQLSLSVQDASSISPDDFSFARFVAVTFLVARLRDGRLNVTKLPLALPSSFIRGVDALVSTSQFASPHQKSQLHQLPKAQQQMAAPTRSMTGAPSPSAGINLLDDFHPHHSAPLSQNISPPSASLLQPTTIKAQATGFAGSRSTSPIISTPLQLNRTGPASSVLPMSSNSLNYTTSNNGDILANNVLDFATTTATTQEWAISAEEQSRYGTFFDDLDTAKRGSLTGMACAPFFQRSNLPQSDLSKIWTLADMDAKGQLDREQFMVFMHLIQRRLQGSDLPSVIPPLLVPLSRRSQAFNTPAIRRGGSNSSIQSAMSIMPVKGSVFNSSFDDIVSGVPSKGGSLENRTGSNGSIGILGSSQLPGDVVQYQNKLNSMRDQRNNLNMQQASLVGQKQELQLQLHSIKAMYDSELSIIAEVKEVVDRERAVVDGYKSELDQLERMRTELNSERVRLEQTIQSDRVEAETFKNKIVSLNFDINNTRSQLERLREDSAREAGNKSLNQQIMTNLSSVHQQTATELESAKQAKPSQQQLLVAQSSFRELPATTAVTPRVTPLSPQAEHMDSSTFAISESSQTSLSKPNERNKVNSPPISPISASGNTKLEPNWDELRNVNTTSPSIFGDISPTKSFENKFPIAPTTINSSQPTGFSLSPTSSPPVKAHTQPQIQTGANFDDAFASSSFDTKHIVNTNSYSATTSISAITPESAKSKSKTATFGFDDTFDAFPSANILNGANTTASNRHPAPSFGFGDVFASAAPILENKTGPPSFSITSLPEGGGGIGISVDKTSINFDTKFGNAFSGPPRPVSQPSAIAKQPSTTSFTDDFSALSITSPSRKHSTIATPSSAPSSIAMAPSFDSYFGSSLSGTTSTESKPSAAAFDFSSTATFDSKMGGTTLVSSPGNTMSAKSASSSVDPFRGTLPNKPLDSFSPDAASFDDAFAFSAPTTVTTNKTQSFQPQPASANAHSFGFEDVFSGSSTPSTQALPPPPYQPTSTPLSGTSNSNSVTSTTAPRATPLPMSDVPVDSSSIDEIIAMGFTKIQAEEALKRYDNNVERALNFLISG